MRNALVAIGVGVVLVATTGAAAAAQPQTQLRTMEFRSCGELVSYATDNVVDQVLPGKLVTPDLVNDTPPPATGTLPGVPIEAGTAPVAAPAPQTKSIEHSGTNVQEAGVDEADIVKSDGSSLFAIAGDPIAGDRLQAVDLTEAKPRVVDSLSLGADADSELYLHGGKLLVISRRYSSDHGYVANKRAGDYAAQTILTEVDVSRPEQLRIVRTLTIDGTYLSSRLSNGTLRMVVNSSSQVYAMARATHPGTAARATAVDRLRESRSRDWLPSYVLRRKRTHSKVKRPLVRCGAVRHAADFSGLDVLTVLTIDLDEGLTPVDSDALMTDADDVYASDRALYVTSERWGPPYGADEGWVSSTSVHKFATINPGKTSYRASGELRGGLLNQFAMSEYKGVLRAATTTESNDDTESYVTALAERDGRLVEVGKVGGLGRGERIYSVRFIDENAFVVTFEQTDPLYTVDISNPRHPRVMGELKIRGYSAYLHPAGDGLLIGVGQDANEMGMTGGTQVSLFDVSDLKEPRRLAHRTLVAAGRSEVEYDHHAFLYWPKTHLAVLPVSGYGSFTGAVGLKLGRSQGISEAGTIEHKLAGSPERVRRTLVADGRIYTVSARGVQASSLQTLSPLGWDSFEQR